MPFDNPEVRVLPPTTTGRGVLIIRRTRTTATDTLQLPARVSAGVRPVFTSVRGPTQTC
jgi:hypothetical protein